MNIGFGCIWLKDRKRTRSHTAYSLYESLDQLDGIHVYDLNASLNGSALFFHKLSNMIVHQGKLKSKYNFSKRYLKSLERNLLHEIQKIKDIDVIIETADIGIIKEIPCVNGYLLNSDSIDELAGLIIKVIEDDKMKSGVERMSKSYQDYYSWNRVASDMVKIIEKDRRKMS